MAHERILLADDEASSQRFCRATLEGAGFSVIEAANGAEMVTRAQAHHPQVIVVDLLMPGMDGFEAVEELRREPGTAAIPLLYLSTLAPEETFTQGVARFLTKPFERQTLLDAVQQVVKVPGAGATPPDLLVADDERDIAEIVCCYLEDLGFQSRAVHDGQAAIAAIEQQPPAGVILDIKMPIQTGYDVIRWVKRHPTHRQIPIVVLTATKLARLQPAPAPTPPRPLLAIPKPCDPARLVSAVQELLDGA